MPPIDVPSEAMEAVVLLVQGSTTCAGAFVGSDGTIATAYHCIATGGPVQVRRRDGASAIARVVATDAGADLALVRADDLAGSPWLVIRTDEPQLGEEAWALGHPMGSRSPGGYLTGTLRWSASMGVVSAVGSRAVQISAPVNPGNSGGPVVDAEGAVIGVVSRRLSGQALGFATRADKLAELIATPRGRIFVGGNLSAMLFVSSYAGDGGTVAGGARLEASFHDLAFVDVAVARPFSGRWDAVRLGEVRFCAAESRLGVRQRLFRGAGTTRIDAYGGIARVEGLLGESDLSLGSTATSGWLAGGAVSFPGLGVGFDVAYVRTGDEGALRSAMVFAWPGRIWAF